MSRRKKGKAPKQKKWQSMTALWVGKSYRDALLPKHIGLSFILHLIFFALFFTFAKSYLENNVQPLAKNIEFNLSKTHVKAPRRKIIQNTIAESPAPSAQTQPSKQVQETTSVSSKKTNTSVSKKAVTQSSAVSQSSDFSDSDMIPMSKIKRSSSGFTRAHSGSSGIISDNSSGSDATGASSQSGVKGTKEITGYDISPYINELRRNIKMNWRVPSGTPNRRVELFLRIAKDGRVMILNVKTTSESGALDESALNAVNRTIPLRPLPSKYGKSYLDVVFVFNPSDGSVR